MLVTFEGQDGVGKTTLLSSVQVALTKRGISSMVVEEFSSSPYGQRLVEAVVRDKFLRPAPGEPATVVNRSLEIVADLYYQDEREIDPALQQGQVVLKDRYVDTVLYTLVPTLVSAGVIREEDRALAWLKILCSKLRHRPTLTVFVEAPLSVRLQRIAARTRDLQEERANEVSGEDIEVFAAREHILRRLISEEPARFVVVDNGNLPLAEGTRAIVEVICTRLNMVSRKGQG